MTRRFRQGTFAFVRCAILACAPWGAAGCGRPEEAAPAALPGLATRAPDDCPGETPDAAAPFLSFRSLRWMGEPLLSCGPVAEDEAYRFIAQSQDPASSPVSVRLSRLDAQMVLVARRYAWAGPPSSAQPLSIVESKVRAIAAPEWTALVAAVGSSGFWDMPEHGDASAPEAVHWNLEGRVGAGYHHVARSPSTGGSFGELAHYVLRLAGYDERLESGPAPR